MSIFFFKAPEVTLKHLVCSSDFQVSLNSTGNDLQEGDVLTLTCVLNLALLNLTFEWLMDGQTLKDYDASVLAVKVLSHDKGHYHCIVRSPCGTYTSLPQEVTVQSKYAFPCLFQRSTTLCHSHELFIILLCTCLKRVH